MKTATETRDPNIWKQFEPMADGFVPAVRREWNYNGRSAAGGGERCNMLVELLEAHPTIADYYKIRAVFAFNTLYCPDYAYLKDLTPVER